MTQTFLNLVGTQHRCFASSEINSIIRNLQRDYPEVRVIYEDADTNEKINMVMSRQAAIKLADSKGRYESSLQ
jgi:hypothetical protein